MFSSIPLLLLELGEVLDHSLHVLDGLELGLALLVGEELLHQAVDAVRHLAEVLVHDLREELVVLLRKNHLPQLLLQVRQVLEVDPVVLDREDFVDHCLVSPLVEQRSHRVFSPVHNQQHCFWALLVSAVEELRFSLDHGFQVHCKSVADVRGLLVPHLHSGSGC